MEEIVSIASDGSTLEGLMQRGRSTEGAVVTHPHPLYGGDMRSPVVEAITNAYRHNECTTLRFNFRGTGGSTGVHDEGVGEQADVLAAVDFLRSLGLSRIHLSGYSFGAWVNAMTLHARPVVDTLTMVAPPVAFIPFTAGIRLPMLSTVVAGSHDEFAPPDIIRPLLQTWNRAAAMEIIDGADHFFFGHLDTITRILKGT